LSGLAQNRAQLISVAEASGGQVPHAPHPRGAEAPLGRVTSRDLLGGRGELIIVHAGREYKLRVTQNGKLILTA
jgi:hemin uptake protein HemP